MERLDFSLTLAGVTLNCRPLHDRTAACFRQFCQPVREDAAGVFALTQADLEAARGLYPPEMEDGILEFNELAPRLADALLPFDRCLFHGAAFLWRGRAYLFTAPSGTGKTTQYILWKLLYGEEIQILNGDKPILEFRDGGEILVHPSPWTGKEGMGRDVCAPLGGLIYLLQGQENAIAPMTPGEAALPLFCQFLFSAGSEAAVRQVCALEERLLRAAPVWRLVNRGDKASARLCHDTILEQEAHTAAFLPGGLL